MTLLAFLVASCQSTKIILQMGQYSIHILETHFSIYLNSGLNTKFTSDNQNGVVTFRIIQQLLSLLLNAKAYLNDISGV